MSKKKEFLVQDLESLRNEFFKGYPSEYWLYKIVLLKNTYDTFETIKPSLIKDFEGSVDEEYKRMIRTEMHFLYFQVVEALFELMFAVMGSDNRDLWVNLTFSDWRKTYARIQDFANGKLTDPDLGRTVKVAMKDKQVEMPALQWIFYFIFPLSLSPDQWKKNLDNIRTMLKTFAKDFSDRGDYNAYKHSLRFYNSSVSFAIGQDGKDMRAMGGSQDSITFLEEEAADGDGKRSYIRKTTKPFSFERDCRCAQIAASLIENIIRTRKYVLLKDLIGKPIDLHKFDGLLLSELIAPKTGVSRFSMRS